MGSNRLHWKQFVPALPFLLVVAAPVGAQTTPTFGPPSQASPSLFAPDMADLNGDGLLDFYHRSACILAQGGGTFSAPIPYPYALDRVKAGDANNDGSIDLIGSPTKGLFDLLNGDGSGNFTSAGTIATHTLELRYTCLSDFNTDGNLDLQAFTVWMINYKWVHEAHDLIFLGNGAGQFTKSLDSLVGHFIFDTGDFNADGKLDWTSAWWNDYQVKVTLGDGQGGQVSNFYLSAGQYGPNQIDMVDVDGDGLQDLAIAYHDLWSPPDPSAVSIIKNSGALQLFYTGTYVAFVHSGDLNGDGQPEVLVFYTGSTLLCLENLGNGSFAAPFPIPAGAGVSVVGIADLTQDGRPDIVYFDETTSNISILPNTLALPTPWVPWIKAIEPYGSPLAALPTPILKIRGTALAFATDVSIDQRHYGPASFQTGTDGNTLYLTLNPPPQGTGIASVAAASPAGTGAMFKYPIRSATQRVTLISPPTASGGQPVTIYFAGPTPGNLILPAASACMTPLPVLPYFTFDIGGCGDIELLPSPAAFDASGLSELAVVVPPTLSGLTVFVQYCDVDIAKLLANQLPLEMSNVFALVIP